MSDAPQVDVSELAAALAYGELHFVYQPRFAIPSGQLSGAEALVRWHHSFHGPIPPSSFVPVAEETGLIHPLTMQALATVGVAARRWHDIGHVLPVAVNFSPFVLGDERMLTFLLDTLEHFRLPAHLFEVEITETRLAEDAAVLKGIRAISKTGVRIVIDDFGTGYSGLSCLRDIHVDGVKLDGRFIRHFLDNASDRAIVRHTVNLAHDLGAEVIAECVEEPNVLAQLAELGCDHAQGYLLGMPEPHLPDLSMTEAA